MSPLRASLLLLLVPVCAPAVELREGVKFEVSYINESLGKVAGPGTSAAINEGLLDVRLELDLTKLLRWKGAVFNASAVYTHGPSLSDRYLGDVTGVSSIDNYDTVRFNELWLEQNLFCKRFSIKAGLMVPVTDFIVCETSGIFFNDSLGTLTVYGVNSGGPNYPLSTPGARVQWEFAPGWTVRAGAYSADAGLEDRNNTRGGRFTFRDDSGGIFLAELERAYGVALPGTVKLGGFHDSGLYEDLSGGAEPERGFSAVYASLEQTLYRPPAKPRPEQAKTVAAEEEEPDERGVAFFVRGGYAFPQDRTLIGWEVQAGLVARGLLFGREEDSLGLAISHVQLGHDARFLDGEPVTAHHESVIEATYAFVATKHLTLQPDVQVFFNPGATAPASTAVVVGLRAMIGF